MGPFLVLAVGLFTLLNRKEWYKLKESVSIAPPVP